jgi:hypothetical protein
MGDIECIPRDGKDGSDASQNAPAQATGGTPGNDGAATPGQCGSNGSSGAAGGGGGGGQSGGTVSVTTNILGIDTSFILTGGNGGRGGVVRPVNREETAVLVEMVFGFQAAPMAAAAVRGVPVVQAVPAALGATAAGWP